MKRRVLALPALLLLLYSCGQSSVFLGQLDEPAQVSVTTLPAGSIIRPGAPVSLSIDRDPVYSGNEQLADSLLIELIDEAGVLLAEQLYDSVDDALELPPIDLPVLEDGFYQLRTTYRDGEEVVTTSTVPFFVSGEPYRIAGLTSYPASSYPEADGLISVALDIPQGSDPYLVWVINGETVASGLLSQTTETIAVLAPGAQGIFPVRVDLYPSMPEGFDAEDVPAPASYSAELVVSNAPAPARFDLEPAGSYFALYHFRGTLRDDGARVRWFPDADFAASPVGVPRLAAEGDVFGYRVDAASGFQMAGSVWPVREGSLTPVSISVRAMMEPPPVTARLLTVDHTAGTLLSLEVEPDGTVTAGLLDQLVRTELPVVSFDRATTTTLTITPGTESWDARFFADGGLVWEGSVTPPDLSSVLRADHSAGPDGWGMLAGVTTIGSSGEGSVPGVSGIIDEVGVYFRDSSNEPAANEELYLDNVAARFGEQLVLVAAFAGEELPDGATVSGASDLAEGALVLAEGAVLSLPSFSFSNETLIVGIESEGEATLLVREADNGAVLATIPFGASEIAGGTTFRFEHQSDELRVGIADQEPRTVSVGSGFPGLTLEVAGTGQLRLLSAYGRYEAPRIPNPVFELSAVEGDATDDR